MSLYDEAFAAGAPGVRPGEVIPADLLQRILRGEEVFGLSVGQGNYIGPQPTESNDQTGNLTNFERVIYGADPGTSGTTARWHTWNPDGTYRGFGSGPGPTIDSLVMAATAAGLGGAAAGWGSTGTGGMSAADMAAMDQAIIDMGASATNVGGGTANAFSGLDAGSLIDAAAADAGSTLVGESVLTSGGAPAASTTVGEVLAEGAMTGGGLATPTFNLPNTPPAAPNTGGNQVVPPVNNNTPGNLPNNLDPSKISDWTSLFNVLSGLYGLKLAGDAAEKSDPFGPYRKGYADKLLALEANPGLIKSTPGFLSGQDAITRQMASKGYLGSGNMAGALMRYSGDFYQNEANRLATLAGSNINPNQTYFNQAQLVGQSLSNIGYGLSPYMAGGPR